VSEIVLEVALRIQKGLRELIPTSGTERKPVDPPPIVQIRVREEGTYLAQ
jgi:hypothetical protein